MGADGRYGIISPMHEFAVTAVDFKLWSEAARERWSDQRFARSLRDRTAFADEGEAFAGWEWLIPILTNTTSNVFEHLGDVVFVIDEPAGVESYLSEFYERLLAAGKAKKVALTACMRKLLTILNAMVKNQQRWQPRASKSV